jgi:hypothetical protein
VFDAVLWTGDGVNNRVISSYQFQPDFAWVKARSQAYWSVLADAVRGATNTLFSNSANAEAPIDVNGYLGAFNSNGFTLTQGSTSINDVNQSTTTYVGWAWSAGGNTVTNTNGSISAQVRANPTAGFSIATYTATGANGTFGHGLGIAPSMVIIKKRAGGTARAWQVYHASLGNGGGLYLSQSDFYTADATAFNNTSPSSSVVSIGSSVYVNESGGTYVAFCFAEIAGFSKFGRYDGNNSTDGPFVYCGFRPKFILIKKYAGGTAANWHLHDTARDTYNSSNTILLPDSAGAEAVSTGFAIDMLSNGFKLRTTDASTNGPAYNHIYMAFAENPFQNSNAR